MSKTKGGERNMNQDHVATQILSDTNVEQARDLFQDAIEVGLQFKLSQNVRAKSLKELSAEELIDPLPETGMSTREVLDEFNKRILPYCYNFSSPKFMGFPDAGNSIAAITGNIAADFLQQNMINQSFCSPSGTFAEISVIRWLREILGYEGIGVTDDIFDAGGVITGGGTVSNTIGIMLARENHRANTMQRGVNIDDDYYLVVPKGIGHYSVKSAQMWLGCGNRLLEVETKDFRYDQEALAKTLHEYKGKIMCLVAYAGDSRTMTVEHFDEIASLVKSIDDGIWLHADACHGFSLGFSRTLRKKIAGIERFDSITTDPQKVMNIPYTTSALLVRDPHSMKLVSSTSDLIMQEQYAFGQITPFIGSKSWMSLKLWFAMKALGREGYEQIIDARHQLALSLAEIIKKSDDFLLVNEVDINAVGFLYTGSLGSDVEKINAINRNLHDKIIEDGIYHLHQFSIPDRGVFAKDTILYPLRFMSGNPNTTEQTLQDMIDYVRQEGRRIEEKV